MNIKRLLSSSKLVTLAALLVVTLVTIVTPVYAQNACSLPDPTNTVADPKSFFLVVAEFSQNNPAGDPIVTGITLSALDGTTAVSSAPVAKTAMVLQAGTPANCYRVNFPTFANVTGNKAYKVSVVVNGPINSASGVSTQSFFLQAAPSAPASIRMAFFDMLSRMFQLVLSTEDTKPWFRPIGR